MISRLGQDLERFLFPNQCIGCDRGLHGVDPDGLICRVCLSRMRPLPRPGCPRCAQPLPPVGPCRYCRDWEPALATVRSAVWLGSEARRLVHGLKYGHMPRLAGVAAEVMARHLPRPARGTILVPIPTTASRRRRRGYNQAERLARALAHRWGPGYAVAPDRLARIDRRGSQTALTPGARLANVAGVFHADHRRCETAGSPPLLLIDDVLTTGATLHAAASALAAAGWSRLAAATFARAASYEEQVMSAPDLPAESAWR